MDSIEKSKRIAISLCKKYTDRGVTFVELYKTCLDTIDDLIKQNKNNPNYDVNEDSRLTWFLRQAITRKINDRIVDSQNSVSYDPEVNEYINEVKKYIIENAKIPKDEDMAKILGKTNEEIKKIKERLN